MKDVRKLTFSEKEQLMRHLARIYRRGRLQTMIGVRGLVEDCVSDEKAIDLSAHICLILKQMTPADALLLENEFFDMKGKDWWKNCYTVRGYHDRKRIAMEQFLRCLYV